MTPSIGHLGVFLHEYDMSLSGHLDKPQMLHLAKMGQPTKPVDFGTLDLWAFKRTEEQPFMNLAFRTGNVEMWDTDEYTFDIATAHEKSVKIVKDISGQAKPGENQRPFEIIVNRYVGAGARVKFDPLHPLEMQVIGNGTKLGEHYKIQLRVVQGPYKEEYVPKQLLAEGSRLTILAHTFNSEFGQEYPSWEISAASKKKFINKITNAPVATSYSVTAEAANFANGMKIDGNMFRQTKNRMVEYVAVKGSSDNGIAYLNDFLNAGGTVSSIEFQTVATLYDDIAVGILGQEGYNMQVWGSGGSNEADGLDTQVFAPGVYFQFDYSGYKNFFTIETFDETVLLGAIKSFTKDKLPTPSLGGEPMYEIRTGDGGWELVTRIFEKYLYNSNVWMGAKEYGFVEGQASTGLAINRPVVTQYRHPLIGILKVVKDSSLNGGREANDLINPYVPGTGHRLSSFTMLIQPWDMNSSNIRLVRPVHLGGGKVDMTVINGRGLTHPLFEQSFGNIVARQGSSLKTGYSAYFETVPDTAIVIDPTKVLKLVPKHPVIPNFGL